MSVAFCTWAHAQTGISPLAKLLLMWLADGRCDSDGVVQRSPEAAAKFCGVTRGEIGIALGDLVDSGLVVSRGGRFVLACGGL